MSDATGTIIVTLLICLKNRIQTVHFVERGLFVALWNSVFWIHSLLIDFSVRILAYGLGFDQMFSVTDFSL